MKFCEAMEKLKQGNKVSRIAWKDCIFFKLVENEVKTYQPILKPYLYDETIIISEGWKIIGDNNEYKFCEIIPLLAKGAFAFLNEWDETYIYFDKDEKKLLLKSMQKFLFTPDFESFAAEDWILIE